MNDKQNEKEICTDETLEIQHSKKIMASYSFGHVVSEYFLAVFGMIVFFYYEVEIGLDSLLVMLGFIIYAVWNAANDPIIGYLTDRPFKFTRKWGRRFPWIYLSAIPWLLAFILIFSPPRIDVQTYPWIIFGWLTFSACLYDSLFSIWSVNFIALFPDKFRSQSERLKVSGIMLPIAFVGLVLGYIVPSMIFKYGDLNSYLIMAIVCVIIGIIGNIVMLPGMREDKESIERYLAKCEEIQKDSFISVMKSCIKHKNFLAVILLYFLYQSMGTSLSASYQYLVKYILKEQPIISTILMLGMFAGALISVPIWLWYANKTKNNKRTAIIGGIILIIAIFPMIFVTNVIGVIIILFILGIGFGCFMIMIFPIFSDVIDEAVIKTHKRNEGTYLGIRFFFGRLALVVQAVSFAIVHISTGFVEGSDTQSPLAIIGIRIHLAVIPIILMTIGILIFAKMYNITPEKAAINKAELKKLGL